MKPKEMAEGLFRLHYEEISGIPKEAVIFYMKEDKHVQSAVRCSIITSEHLECCDAKPGGFYWNEVKTHLQNMIWKHQHR